MVFEYQPTRQEYETYKESASALGQSFEALAESERGQIEAERDMYYTNLFYQLGGLYDPASSYALHIADLATQYVRNNPTGVGLKEHLFKQYGPDQYGIPNTGERLEVSPQARKIIDIYEGYIKGSSFEPYKAPEILSMPSPPEFTTTFEEAQRMGKAKRIPVGGLAGEKKLGEGISEVLSDLRSVPEEFRYTTQSQLEDISQRGMKSIIPKLETKTGKEAKSASEALEIVRQLGVQV